MLGRVSASCSQIATMEDMYGRANPKPLPAIYDADDLRAMRAAEERAALEGRASVTGARCLSRRNARWRLTARPQSACGRLWWFRSASVWSWSATSGARTRRVKRHISRRAPRTVSSRAQSRSPALPARPQSYVEVYVLLPPGVEARDARVTLTPTSILVTLGEETVLQGELFAPIKAEESVWLVSARPALRAGAV